MIKEIDQSDLHGSSEYRLEQNVSVVIKKLNELITEHNLDHAKVGQLKGRCFLEKDK